MQPRADRRQQQTLSWSLSVQVPGPALLICTVMVPDLASVVSKDEMVNGWKSIGPLPACGMLMKTYEPAWLDGSHKQISKLCCEGRAYQVPTDQLHGQALLLDAIAQHTCFTVKVRLCDSKREFYDTFADLFGPNQECTSPSPGDGTHEVVPKVEDKTRGNVENHRLGMKARSNDAKPEKDDMRVLEELIPTPPHEVVGQDSEDHETCKANQPVEVPKTIAGTMEAEGVCLVVRNGVE